MTLPSIRDEFPMLENWTHFNCGGMAPLSNAVGAELLRVPQSVINDGPGQLLAHDESFLRIETARSTLARMINSAPDEVALTTQFSSSVNIVTEGTDWATGDEVIVTDQEHPALLIPLMNAVRRHGLKVHRIPWSNDPEEMLTSYRGMLNKRTKLVAVSHVTTDSGSILPAKEMTRLAHEHGARTFFDGAHSVGQIPVDMRDLDCDYYGIVGYKWLLGPYPSAALYMRADLLDNVEVTWTGSNATQTGSVTMGPEELDWVPNMRRFEYGGRPYSYDSAMGVGAAWVEQMGVESILEHSRHLASYFHDGLASIPAATLHSPEPGQATGIATVSLSNMDGVALSDALREDYRFVQRRALWGTAVRISLSAFIEEKDVDLLLDALTTVSKR